VTTVEAERPATPPTEPVADSGVEIVALTSSDADTLQRLRLEALEEDSGRDEDSKAFASSHAVEEKWSEQDWVASLESTTWVAAREAGVFVGIARCVLDDENLSARYIESVWVRVGHRCKGILRQMLNALEEHAREERVELLQLWVLDTNSQAWNVYKGLGFRHREGDEHKVLTSSGMVIERRMKKRLT
jgi:ribosomal protein S18 acetylase RimI-like enzyme